MFANKQDLAGALSAEGVLQQLMSEQLEKREVRQARLYF